MNLSTRRSRAGLVFSLAIACNLLYQLLVSVLVLAFHIQLEFDFTAFLLVQTFLPIVVAGGVLLFAGKRGGATLPSVFSLRKPGTWDLQVGIVLGVAVCFSSGFLNELFSRALNEIGIHNGLNLPAAPNTFGLVLFCFVLCVLPAISEELVFRGAITSYLSAEKTSTVCLISGALFALMHMNLAQMLNAFLVGMFLTLITLRTGSIFPAMAIHFVNNLTTVLAENIFSGRGLPVLFWDFTLFEVIAAAVCLIPIGLALWRYLKRPTRAALEPLAGHMPAGTAKDFWLSALPGLIFAGVFTLLTLLS